MQVTEEQVKKLLINPPKFNQLGMSMLVTRLAGQYAKTPSPEFLRSGMMEINAFLEKYEMIISVDYDLIRKL